VIVVFGEVGEVIVPLPETKVHKPVPTIGVLAAIEVVGEEIQSVCEIPAFAIVGISFTTIAIVAEEEAQGELEIVHWKIFVPNPNPLIVVFGKVGEEIVPLPETKVHKPVPTIGVFAAIVVVGEEIQSVCEVPALAIVGAGLIVIVTFELEGVHGELEIVQAKTFVPIARPVMVELGKVGEVIVPLPETSVHNPVPTVGVLAAIVVVGDEIQSVCDVPAFAIVGASLTRIVIVEILGAQGEFEIVH